MNVKWMWNDIFLFYFIFIYSTLVSLRVSWLMFEFCLTHFSVLVKNEKFEAFYIQTNSELLHVWLCIWSDCKKCTSMKWLSEINRNGYHYYLFMLSIHVLGKRPLLSSGSSSSTSEVLSDTEEKVRRMLREWG